MNCCLKRSKKIAACAETPQGLILKAYKYAKGKNEFQCQKTLQSNGNRKDHASKKFQASHSDKKN